MLSFKTSVFIFTIIVAGFFTQHVYAQDPPCSGENMLSDGVCFSNPVGAGALSGRAAGVVTRLEEILGNRGRSTIRSFERIFDSSPTDVQEFALRTLVPMVAEGSKYESFDIGSLRNFTSSLRSIGTAHSRGFEDIPCAAGLGSSSLERYTDYNQALFVQNLLELNPDQFIGARPDINGIRAITVEAICSKLAEPPVDAVP